jgi:hypothetical protein
MRVGGHDEAHDVQNEANNGHNEASGAPNDHENGGSAVSMSSSLAASLFGAHATTLVGREVLLVGDIDGKVRWQSVPAGGIQEDTGITGTHTNTHTCTRTHTHTHTHTHKNEYTCTHAYTHRHLHTHTHTHTL